MISNEWDAVLKATAASKGKHLGTIRTETSLYRQIKRKYSNKAGTFLSMFTLLEPVLFELDVVTLQEADKHPKNGPSKHYRREELPDNLVYNEGVDWSLILDNWVLTQVTKEAWGDKVAKEAARFVELGYTPFSIPPFALWKTLAYDTLLADPKAFTATLNKLTILTLRSKLAKAEQSI